jgi:hypothetical protein
MELEWFQTHTVTYSELNAPHIEASDETLQQEGGPTAHNVILQMQDIKSFKASAIARDDARLQYRQHRARRFQRGVALDRSI